MSITICTVSGKLLDATTTAIVGATVYAYSTRPYIHPTDSSLVVNEV